MQTHVSVVLPKDETLRFYLTHTHKGIHELSVLFAYQFSAEEKAVNLILWPSRKLSTTGLEMMFCLEWKMLRWKANKPTTKGSSAFAGLNLCKFSIVERMNEYFFCSQNENFEKRSVLVSKFNDRIASAAHVPSTERKRKAARPTNSNP